MPEVTLEGKEVKRSIFVFGPNRSGKTDLLASARDLLELNPAVIDADDGLATWLKYRGKGIEGIKIWAIPNVNKLEQIPLILDFIRVNKIKLVMVDSITYWMNSVMIERNPDCLKVHPSEWDFIFRNFSVFIGKLKAYCSHIVFTGFAETTEDMGGKTMLVEPMILGRKFPSYLLSHFNVIGYLNTKTTNQYDKVYYKTSFNTLTDGVYCVGDRLDSLGRLPKTENERLSLKMIFDKMDVCLKGGEVKC